MHKDDKKIIDSLLRTIRADPAFLYKNEQGRLALVDQLNQERSKRWEKIGKCYFPQCSNNAIQSSHSLSDKMMIRPISNGSHVFGPKVNTFAGKYEVGKISVSKASIFPGFCQYHENLFTFEKEGEMNDGTELQMQLFRSICRQLFFLKHERDSILHYLKDMRKRLLVSVEKSLSLTPLLKTSINELKGYIDSIPVGIFDLMVELRDKDITYTVETWYKPNADGFGKLLSGNFYDELVVHADLLPVVLSAPILFDDCPRDRKGTPDFDYVFYVNIFPNKGKTLVHMASLKQQKDKLEKLAASFEKDNRVLHTYVRKWMIKYCDHWYVSPKFWKGSGKNVRENIIQGLAQSAF